MIAPTLSDAEKKYLTIGIGQQIRNDGRGLSDYRSVSIDSGVIPRSFGSARVTIGRDPCGTSGTDVLAAVKAEVMVPTFEKPGEGEIVVSVDCLPPLFAGVLNRREAREDVNAELSAALRRLVTASFPLESLCVMKGRFAWRIFIDVIVFQNDGNLSDACSMAAWVSLRTTRLPKLTPIEAEACFEDEFDLDSNAEHAVPLMTSSLAVGITLCLIGDHLVVDPSPSEEACCTARMIVAVNERGQFCGMHKAGGISMIPAPILPEVLRSALATGRFIFEGLRKGTNERESFGSQFPDVPTNSLGFFS
mmetsp:Transcript_60490/g.82994  ORF Transcript_60490/g.82994 Transcript_60490/m.82994 type:complete len:306 (-) Transcript_60490:304-1221(-)|eukprot:CAMPEP_0185774338 /NCGR_PEP_ID=MMETSP1174-20130828/77685_1 /TAXON_ID=35687 /ORGANISM="Dictyocha speculum, Strain CCMP1381" /LENGTH=305 /DNA_ID=CAMNT_0028461447 /DNA_START=29 /DNA_END=946 /DNA_ORIENTATION=+